MPNKKWVFNEVPNVAVLTTKEVIFKKRPILYVTHDEDDGMWQFHDGFEPNIDDAMMVSLKEIVMIDASIEQLNDLPLGWYAWRKNSCEDWKRGKVAE